MLTAACGLPANAPREYALTYPTTTLGRVEDQDVQLDSAAYPGLISRQHCTITREDAGGGRQRFLLEDCSTHGVSVDDTPVEKGVRVELHDGAVLGFGRAFKYPVKLTFRAHPAVLVEQGASPVGARGNLLRTPATQAHPLNAKRSPALSGMPTAAKRGNVSSDAEPATFPRYSRDGNVDFAQPSATLLTSTRSCIEALGACIEERGAAELSWQFNVAVRALAQLGLSSQAPLVVQLARAASADAADALAPRARAASAPRAERAPDDDDAAADDDDNAAAAAAAAAFASAAPLGGKGLDADGVYPGWQKRARINHHQEAVQAANQRVSGPGALREEYGAPPFSVLDGRAKGWRERRAYWERDYHIESALGRNENLMGYGGGALAKTNTSVFDSQLCELMYRWFAPPGGSVLDPFAGGSVRGCVAARLGLGYHGVELSKPQIDANERQARRLASECADATVTWTPPRWYHADARQIASLRALPAAVDFVFSCPPYYDLEQYSDDPRDLSNAQTYAEFLQGYEAAIAGALKRLRRNRFACFVVGEVRDRTSGLCLNLVGETINIFQRYGAMLYNSAVLLTMCNTAPLRARKIFELLKLTPCHQNVLVFFNGDDANEHIRNIGCVPNQAISWE